MLHLLTRRSRRHCSATLIESREIEKKKKQKKQQDSFVFNVHLSRVFFLFVFLLFFFTFAPFACLFLPSVPRKSVGQRLSHFSSSSSSSLFPFSTFLFFFFVSCICFFRFFHHLPWNGMACRGIEIYKRGGPLGCTYNMSAHFLMRLVSRGHLLLSVCLRACLCAFV